MATTIINPTGDTYLTALAGAQGTNNTIVGGQFILNYIPNQLRPIFRFDLTAYAGASIGLALFRLQLISTNFPGGVHTISAHEITTTTWLETEATYTHATNVIPWNTIGGDFSSTPFAQASISTGMTELEMDISQFIRSKKGGSAEFGLLLPAGLVHLNHFFTCHSREASVGLRPELVLVSLYPRIAKSVDFLPKYQADSIRIAHMFDFLPANNEVTIQVNGYRDASTRGIVADAEFEVTIYNAAGTSVIDGTLDAIGSGNYRGSLNASGLTLDAMYKVVIEDVSESPSQTVWTRWFRAKNRPTSW
jgi:hypothetical protein